MTIETLLKSYSGISMDTIYIYLKDSTIKISGGIVKVYDMDCKLIDSMYEAVRVIPKMRGKRLGTFTVISNKLLIYEKGSE